MKDKDDLRARFLSESRALPTSRLGRLVRTGRAAGAMAGAVLGARLRGSGEGLDGASLADVERLVGRLGELKGVAMKAGQILAYIDPALAPELRATLSVLHTASPAAPFSEIETTLREAFGARASELLDGVVREPIAVASIGQVHRASVWGEELAIKVRHRGIVAALESDFATAEVAPLLARALGMNAGANVEGFVAEVRAALQEETDFALEADRQEIFGRFFSRHPTLIVPAVSRAWCARAVLATDWSPGQSLDALLASSPDQAARDRIGVALFELYVRPLYRLGVFHADPHPGNYAFTSECRVVVYDFGCVRAFDRGSVASFARLVAAVRKDDRRAVTAAFTELGASPPSDDDAYVRLRTLLRGFFAPLLARGAHRIDASATMDARSLLRDKRALIRLNLPGRLLFLLRIRFGLYAVLARLGAKGDWASLESAWAEEGVGDSSRHEAPASAMARIS
jgi:predicted unusual protein kinase regulating ubiquinone biosynthesis (AarF/ABC1/UbiB family)